MSQNVHVVYGEWEQPYGRIVNQVVHYFHKRREYLKNDQTGKTEPLGWQEEEIQTPSTAQTQVKNPDTEGHTISIAAIDPSLSSIVGNIGAGFSVLGGLGNAAIPPTKVSDLFTGFSDSWSTDGFKFFSGSAVLYSPNTPPTSNMLTFGASSTFQELEALLLVGLMAKFTQTEDGRRHIAEIITTYLKSCAQVIASLNHSGSQNYVNNVVNQMVSVGVFQRLGFISPLDAFTTKVYLDHIVDIFYKKDILKTGLDAVTTMVDASSSVEKSGDVRGEYESTAGKGLLALLKGLG